MTLTSEQAAGCIKREGMIAIIRRVSSKDGLDLRWNIRAGPGTQGRQECGPDGVKSLAVSAGMDWHS